ncbi:WG repeat-containing protein, partial [Campylobacter coli]
MRKLQILITLFLALFLGACESVDSLSKQCENNNSNACTSLGFLYDYGKEVEKNTQKAKEFYQKACDLGDKKGCSYYSENQWKVFFDNGYFGFKDQNDSVVIEPKFDLALDFKNGVARVMQDEKFGLIDKNGNFIIEPQFEDIPYFSDNVFKAKIASKIVEISKKTYARDSVIKTKWYWKWKLIDSSGKMIFDQKFGDEDHPYLKNNIFFDKGKLKRIYIKGKAGFIDNEGKIIVEPKFDSIQDFKKGFAAVKLKGKWGFVDENGKMIIKAKYDDVADFNEGFAKVKLNKKWGFVDENGEALIETKFDKVADFENGFARVKLNNKWGLINTKGEFFLKPEFDYIKQLKNAAIVEKDKKYGIVNFDGKILEPQFDYIKDYNNETFLLEKDLRVGLANKETRVIIEPKFDKISYLQNNVFEVVVDEKRGLFDIKSEQFILEPKFDSIFNFSNNLVTASFQGREGIFDIKNRRFVLEPKFDRIYDECRANIIGLNGKYGIINDKAELIVPIKYDDISTCFSNDMYLVKTKGKIGFINKNAEFVIPNQFDVIVSFKYGFMEVKLVRYEKSGLINLKGDLILPFEFDSIYYIEPLAKSSLELSKMREANKDLSASKEQIF